MNDFDSDSIVPLDLQKKVSSHAFSQVVDEALRLIYVTDEQPDKIGKKLENGQHSSEFLANWSVRLDECTWAGIGRFRDGYRRARDEGDDRGMEYNLNALRELLSPSKRAKPISAEIISRERLSTKEGREIDAEIRARVDRFHRRYHELKDRCGIMTYKELADKAGVSKNTILKIEQGRGGLPQWKTIKRLAAVFEIDATELAGR